MKKKARERKRGIARGAGLANAARASAKKAKAAKRRRWTGMALAFQRRRLSSSRK